MSRHWTEKRYISVDSLWIFIDKVSSRLELLSQHDSVESSELCKLELLGRRETLDAFCEFVHDNEADLRDIVINEGVLTEDQVKEDLKGNYGL